MELKFEAPDGEVVVYYGVTDFEPLGAGEGADYLLRAPQDHEIDCEEVAGDLAVVIDSAHVPHDEVPHPKDGDEIHDWRTEGYHARLGEGAYA